VIEEEGSRIAGGPVRVSGVEIGLRDGRGSIRGLRIANPEGFSKGDVFSLGEIAVQLDVASLAEPPYRLKEVTIGAPEVRFELDARARSNVQVILDRVKASSGSAKKGGAPESEGGKPVELRIDVFRFADGRLSADAGALGGERGELQLPPLTKRDLAGEPAEIGAALLDAYAASVVRTVAASQIGDAADRVTKEAGKALRDLLGRGRD
jgi:uncharacterized protein involved in outer membrane biogenesis